MRNHFLHLLFPKLVCFLCTRNHFPPSPLHSVVAIAHHRGDVGRCRDGQRACFVHLWFFNFWSRSFVARFIRFWSSSSSHSM